MERAQSGKLCIPFKPPLLWLATTKPHNFSPLSPPDKLLNVLLDLTNALVSFRQILFLSLTHGLWLISTPAASFVWWCFLARKQWVQQVKFSQILSGGVFLLGSSAGKVHPNAKSRIQNMARQTSACLTRTETRVIKCYTCLPRLEWYFVQVWKLASQVSEGLTIRHQSNPMKKEAQTSVVQTSATCVLSSE